MSARSIIRIKEKNGKIMRAYVHYDGYPEHMEPILHGYYNTYEDALDLVAKGQMRSIDTTLDTCDCSEEDAFSDEVDNLEEFLKLDYGSDYKYLFVKGE